ncbi:MAG: hypothetical protein MR619_00270 [Eubacterium sp.]|nr:hypothetical protein [Eubacterium sp.]
MQGNDFLKILMVTAPFVLLCVIYKSVNLKKENRGYQFASVIFGIVYSIAGVASSDRISDKILSQLKVWAQQLTVYAQQNPDKADICNRIVAFINKVDWEYYMIFIINFLVFAVFLIVKAILLPIFKSIWKNEPLFSATSGICYEWSEERRVYVLKEKFCAVRTIMNVYYALAVAIAIALLDACKLNPNHAAFQATLYPFALVIIVGEIVFFLGGKLGFEFVDDLGGEGGESYKIVNYYRLRKYLTTVFGDRIIDQDTKLPKFVHLHNNSEIVKKYENIDSQEAMIANLYFKKLNEQGVQLDEGYVEATYRLLNGESVLFANPFYKDFSDYIFLPLNRAETKGNKILFILGRNGIEEDVIQWINDSFEKVINVPQMWNVGKLNPNEEFDGDVGIVTPADIFNNDIVALNTKFLSKVSQVVLIEPSQFVSTSQLSISVYITKVRSNATFYVIDKNSDGLVDSISHITRTSIKEVSATNKEHNRYSYMLWKADGKQLNHRLFPNTARYLGVGTELMIAAIRNQVNYTEWYSYSKFPVIDMKWISEQYYSALCSYASLNPKQEELEKRMKFNNNMWGAEKREYEYLVAEDEFCNVFETARQFSTRGKSEVFVNVIAQNYLLRDYMEYNPALFENDPKAIPSFCPDYARTERNIVIEILLRLSAGPVEGKELVKTLQYISGVQLPEKPTKYDLKNTVFNLVHKYFENECAKYVVTDTTLLDERNDVYYISNKDFVEEAVKSLRCAYYVLEDEESEKHYLDAKLFGHIYQAHLPGQHIVIGGKYYEVAFVDGSRGVIVKRAADHIHSREYYRQLRYYSISRFETEDAIGGRKTLGSIIVERGFMSFSVSTKGYLLMQDYGDVKNAFKKEISNIPNREYSTKYALKITLPNASDKTRITVALMFNEIFKTLYPDNCDYICAVTRIPEDIDVPQGIMFESDINQEDDGIYIIEDSVLDLGLITSVERNLKRFFQIITDFLKWHELALLPIPVKSEKVEMPKPQDQNQSEPSNASSGKSKKRKGLKDLFKRRKNKKSPQPEDSAQEQPTGNDTADGVEAIPDIDEIVDTVEAIVEEEASVASMEENSEPEESAKENSQADETNEQADEKAEQGSIEENAQNKSEEQENGAKTEQDKDSSLEEEKAEKASEESQEENTQEVNADEEAE